MTAHQPLLSLLPKWLCTELMSAGRRRLFADAQVIHTQEATTSGLSIVLSGRVRFGLFTEQGQYNLTGILGSGHCFGEATLFADRPRAYHADAFGDTEVLAISKSAFDRLYQQHAVLARAVTVTITQRLYETLDFSDELRRETVEQQIVRLLFRIARTGGFGDGALPLRQNDLAYSLGVSRVRIGRAIDHLRDLGAISTGYGLVQILPEAKHLVL